ELAHHPDAGSFAQEAWRLHRCEMTSRIRAQTDASCLPPRSWDRAWRLLTGLLSMSRCPRCRTLYTPRSRTCSGLWNRMLCCWLLEHSTWRWVFFLNLPLALMVVLLSAKVPESRNERAWHHLDWLGALLATVGLGGVTYALIEWPARAHHDGRTIAATAGLGV